MATMNCCCGACSMPAAAPAAILTVSPATAQQLREVGEFLVDIIHGQHAHQSLLRTDAQRALLDTHAGLSELALKVAAAFRMWREAEQMLQLATTGAEALEREREQLEWQVRELATRWRSPRMNGRPSKPSTTVWDTLPA